MRTYTSYLTDIPRVINNSSSDNLTWGMETVMDSIRQLVTKYYFNERAYTFTTIAGQQFYNLPPRVKKLINMTVEIGGVKWQPQECPSRQYWDSLNVITFTQDYPSFFFVYNGQVGIYPTPATTGNTVTLNYKTRIVDLSMADVTSVTASTTISAVQGSATLTTVGSTFKRWMDEQWIRIPFSSTDATCGDNQWYQIEAIASPTTVILKNPYSGENVTGGAFTIGEVPILPEDYQDLPLWRMAIIYYTTRFPDPVRADQYQKLWDIGEAKLNEEFGSKTSSVVLTDTNQEVVNPNLFVRSVSQNPLWHY